MELELNSLDWNVNELEHELELEDMKRTTIMTAVWPFGQTKKIHGITIIFTHK